MYKKNVISVTVPNVTGVPNVTSAPNVTLRTDRQTDRRTDLLYQAKDAGAAEEWFRHFINYCQYREYNDDGTKALFKVLMVGAAGDWLESLSEQTRDSWALLKEAFNSRYKAPDDVRQTSRKQGPDESVDQLLSSYYFIIIIILLLA